MSDDPKLIDEKDPALGSAEKRDDGLTGDPREGQPQGDGKPAAEKDDDKDEAKKPASKPAKKG